MFAHTRSDNGAMDAFRIDLKDVSPIEVEEWINESDPGKCCDAPTGQPDHRHAILQTNNVSEIFTVGTFNKHEDDRREGLSDNHHE